MAYFCANRLRSIVFFYYIVINFLHSSFSLVSVLAILLPYFRVIRISSAIWKKKNIGGNKQRLKKVLIAVVIIATVPVVYLMILLGINENHSTFTQEKWLNDYEQRVRIVGDLLSRYQLKKMTKSEIIQLLGEPTETEYFAEPNNIVYYLGPERGFISIDSEWLVIWFDVQDRVTKFKILRD